MHDEVLASVYCFGGHQQGMHCCLEIILNLSKEHFFKISQVSISLVRTSQRRAHEQTTCLIHTTDAKGMMNLSSTMSSKV